MGGLADRVESETQGEGSTSAPRGSGGSQGSLHPVTHPLVPNCRRVIGRRTSWAPSQGLPGGGGCNAALPPRDGISSALLAGPPGGEG